MSTITSSTTSYTSTTTSYTDTVSSFKNSAEDLLKDQVTIGAGGTYDSYAASTNTEFEDPSAIDLSGIYSSAMGSTEGVTYGESGDIESVDIETLKYSRMSDYQNMLKMMLGEEPAETSVSEMVAGLLSASTSAAFCGVTTALTTDDGAYSVDSVAADILAEAEELAGDDLDALAALKDAFIEAYENAGDSDSALSSDTYDKVLSGFADLEADITGRLEAAAEEEAETDTDVDVDADADVEVETDTETEA